MRVLVVNAGSSSLKLSLVADGAAVASRQLPALEGRTELLQLRDTLKQRDFAGADAVGHRIVHGGSRFREPVLIDRQVRHDLDSLVELAPLHQPKSLQALEAVSSLLPGVPAVGCFDTSFHATLSPAASTYALPAEWNRRWRLRRYGFHGLSHAWVARRTPEMLGMPASALRIVSCHLGAGASLCAIRDGLSVETTMGFTPLEGLVMATRSGSVDPGLLLWLLEHEQISTHEMATGLENSSGLLGLTGDGDMRAVLARAAAGEEQAALGVQVYLHRLRSGIGAMVAALEGIDALVFTGGVGEHAAEIRQGTVAGLGYLDVSLDEAANAQARPDVAVQAGTGSVPVLVIQAREDLEIARQVQSVLSPTR